MSTTGDVILRFKDVSFNYSHTKPILDEASFSVHEGAKLTIMGQNGAGKSTIFKLITGALTADSGRISLEPGVTIGTARQVIPREQMDMTMRDYFMHALAGLPEGTKDSIDQHIHEVLEVVNFRAPLDRKIGSFSGGQQSRLLLASALIQHPDILLLDEPTNNLDKAGIEHLTEFLIGYDKTCLVISHDADFLNSFTDGVLYLDIFTRKVDQYVGDYYSLQIEIEEKIERDRRKNAQLRKEILDRKEKINFFANKGGKMRRLASKLRDQVEEAEENMVDTRREDKTIRAFTFPKQENLTGEIVTIFSVVVVRDHEPVRRPLALALKSRQRLLLRGPNGIGKTTLLETIARGGEGTRIAEGVRVGYYRQDFSTLPFEDTVYQALVRASQSGNEQEIRSVAAGFLLGSEVMASVIGTLSEGQKGLVAFASLVLQRPGLLILDEPTNHINFRHIPRIAEALAAFEGAMILVSHVPDFVAQIKVDQELDLERV